MKQRITALLFLSLLIMTIPGIAAAGSLSVEKTPGEIQVFENGHPVLTYQKTDRSIQGEYKRSNYIHPLYNLKGAVITEDFPEDHLHQRGVFWTWHQILQGDRRLADGWICSDITWDVVSAEVEISPEGLAILQTEVLWKSPNLVSDSGDIIPFVKENAAITIYPAQSDSREIDFEIRLLALEPDIRIGGSEDPKGYGGFSPRIVLPEDVSFRGIHGEITPQTNAVTAGPVVDITGTFSGKDKNGIAIIQHPSNPAFPQGWILRSSKSMQNPVYPGRDPVEISTSNPVILRYRLVLHGPDEYDLQSLFEEYSKQKF